jgi:fibronectin type 3 domain-containing protein
MPPIPPATRPGEEEEEEEEVPNKILPGRDRARGHAPTLDGALQVAGPTSAAAPTTLASFDGINNLNGVLPPDSCGAIGPNHYLQFVNLSLAVYSRTGTVLYGPVAGKTIWQGFGGACETYNDGDPVVLYDQLADRWMVSQFAFSSSTSGPYYECIAVSQTGDPLGAWNRYAFVVSQTKLDDYPKLGVWPDGYYMSVNQFTGGSSWGGAGAVVFERQAILAGQAARMVYYDLYSVDSNLGGMLPASLDGTTLPPAGAPNYYVAIDDDAWGYSPDQIELWQFAVNWAANPPTYSFTQAGTLPTAAFDSDMCSGSRNCISQPGGTSVDAISDRAMFRLQYRNFGDHQSLVFNHTVDVNGADLAGIRWYELRNTSSTWSIYQQGTYSPTTDNRWMGSVAMNGAGHLAIGYSVSSTTVYPSVSYAGRLSTDPLGQITSAEGSCVAGAGSQSHSSGRWGDYSTLTVDPTDDCTFWYTQEYYAASGSATWRTRICSFRIADCAPPAPPSPPTGVGASDGIFTDKVQVSWTAANTAASYQVYRNTSNASTGATQIGTPTGTSYDDTSATAGTTYYYFVKACNTVGCSDFSSSDSGFRSTGGPTPPTVTASDGDYTDKVRVSWTSSTGATYYRVYRNTSSSSSGAIQIQGAATASPYDDTTATPTTTYYYFVKACTSAGCGEFSTPDQGYRALPPPGPPTAVSASDGTYDSEVRVAWTASDTATSYQVFRNTSNASTGATQIGTPSASPYDDTSASAGAIYYYFVKACNSGGCSGFSLSDSGYRSLANATYDATLLAPKCGSPVPFCDSGTLLVGRASLGPELHAPNTIASSCTDGTAGTFHSDESLDRLQISSLDGTNLAPGKSARIDATVWAWSTPSSDYLDLYLTTDATAATLVWTLLTPTSLQPTASGAFVLSQTITLPATGATQWAIRGNFRYSSGTQSYCSSGTFDDRDDLVFVVDSSPPSPPLPPTGVGASDGTYTDKVQVSWSAASGATSYQVYRNTSNASVGATQIGAPTASPYDDTTATPGATYYYFVKACNTAGCSDFSASDSGYRALSAPTGVTASDGSYTDKVQVSWTASTGATSYTVYRNTSNSSGGATQIGTPTASPYDDTTATVGATYYYFVKACNTSVCSDFSASDSGYRAIPAPTGVAATDGSYIDKVQVSWNAVTAATSYQVYRNASNTSSGATQIGTPATSPYSDTTGTSGTLYYYFVKACNASVCSDFSASDSGYRSAAPPNDDFAGATPLLAVPFLSNVDTTNATTATDDPVLTACSRPAGTKSVWYSYTPSTSRLVYLDTFGSNYDTMMGVFTGSRGSLAAVACSDDDSRSPSGINSAVSLNATAGTTYYIVVYGFAGTKGAPTPSFQESAAQDAAAATTLQFHATTFYDVPGNFGFWRYIEGFYAKGITTGCSGSPFSYCPGSAVTRDQMAVFLLRAMHGSSYQPPAATGIFSDPSVNLWMQAWVEEFYREGITTGCGANPLRFCPEDQVTRDQMAVFVLRAMHGASYQPPAATGIFADPSVNAWMQAWVEEYYREGITTGCGTNPLRYCPGDPVKRADMAAFISRAYSITQLP